MKRSTKTVLIIAIVALLVILAQQPSNRQVGFPREVFWNSTGCTGHYSWVSQYENNTIGLPELGYIGNQRVVYGDGCAVGDWILLTRCLPGAYGIYACNANIFSAGYLKESPTDLINLHTACGGNSCLTPDSWFQDAVRGYHVGYVCQTCTAVRPYRCTDTDGGETPNTKGTVTVTKFTGAYAGQIVTRTDTCRNTEQVEEYMCSSAATDTGRIDATPISCASSTPQCSNGRCTTADICTDSCATRGDRRCTGTTVQECVTISNPVGCNQWQTAQEQCASGTTCTGAGNCVENPACTNDPACTTDNDKGCSPGRYVCVYDGNTPPCLVKQTVAACASNETCGSNGGCISANGSVVQECQEGAQECVNAQTLRTCSLTGNLTTPGWYQTQCLNGCMTAEGFGSCLSDTGTGGGGGGGGSSPLFSKEPPIGGGAETSSDESFVAKVNKAFGWAADSKNGLYVLLGGALLLVVILFMPRPGPTTAK